MDMEAITSGQQGQPAPAAQKLANKGRGGDTEVAHVTPGEIVVPVPFQTPEVLSFLQQVFAGNNVDMSQYTVGSTTQSINPETGQPEFFGKFLKKAFKAIAPIALTVAGAATGNPLLAAAGSGIGTKLSGGSWGQALLSAGTAGVTSGLGGTFGQGLTQYGPATAAQMADPFFQAGQSFAGTGIGSLVAGGLNALPSSSALSGALGKALMAGITGGSSGGERQTNTQNGDVSNLIKSAGTSPYMKSSDFSVNSGTNGASDAGDSPSSFDATANGGYGDNGSSGIFARAADPSLITEGPLTMPTAGVASTSDVSPWDQVKSARVLKFNPSTGMQQFAAPPMKKHSAKPIGTHQGRGRQMPLYSMVAGA